MSASLDISLHVAYIQNLDKRKDLAYHLTEHLRLNGVYWGLTALFIMRHESALDREDMIAYVLSCWDDEAGTFGAHPGHDGHILATLSAVQIMAMQDAMDRIDTVRVVRFLLSLIRPDGSVAGDSFGETDTRFSYILIQTLTLLGRLSEMDDLQLQLPGADRTRSAREMILENIQRSMNFDGGFGTEPGAESHGGQVWVCVAALALLGEMASVDRDLLGAWLSERQLPNGGLNGRPEKLEDVCYSWWDVAALSILGRLHWISRDKLMAFILGAQASSTLALSCHCRADPQDLDGGGIADRPGDWVDVFHTVFGLAGLSLLGFPGLQDIDPLYCMPAKVIRRMGIEKTYTPLPRLAEWKPI